MVKEIVGMNPYTGGAGPSKKESKMKQRLRQAYKRGKREGASAPQEILSYCQTVWGGTYVLDARRDVWQERNNGPSFDSLVDALNALETHIDPTKYRNLKQAIRGADDG